MIQSEVQIGSIYVVKLSTGRRAKFKVLGVDKRKRFGSTRTEFDCVDVEQGLTRRYSAAKLRYEVEKIADGWKAVTK